MKIYTLSVYLIITDGAGEVRRIVCLFFSEGRKGKVEIGSIKTTTSHIDSEQ